MARKPVDWFKRRKPVTLDEAIRLGLLEPARRDATAYSLPQTVFPTKWFGADFVGADCLVNSACAITTVTGPVDAVGPGMVTVLPAYYFGWVE